MKKYIPAYATLQISLKAILKNKKGEILLLKNRPTGSMPNFYDFPGGRITDKEIGLPFTQILKRELREELGHKVNFNIKSSPTAIGRHKYTDHTGKTRHVVWLLFLGVYKSGSIKISHEHFAHEWKKLSKSNLKKLFTKGALDASQNLLKH